MKIEDLDDLRWRAEHQIGDITISMIQGKGCYGKRHSNTFEVLLWDSNGNISLGDNDIGEYLSADEVIKLIHSLQSDLDSAR